MTHSQCDKLITALFDRESAKCRYARPKNIYEIRTDQKLLKPWIYLLVYIFGYRTKNANLREYLWSCI